MAQIQWYPGHMHKAAREIREVLSQVDMFIELLDARIPYSSENPMLAEIRASKRCLKVLSRSDLADAARTEEWINWFKTERDTDAVATSMYDRQLIRGLTGRCRQMFAAREQAITVMVAGIPNVGKSTLINILADRVIAKTGNEPAITKRQQRIPLDRDVVLMDTPGVLWPNVENPDSGYRLAATGAIRETAMSHDQVAWFLAEFLLEQYPHLLQERYQYALDSEDPMLLFEHIGRARGCIKSGGKLDLDRASRVLLNDFREGAIGRITLETPTMMEKELIEVAQRRQQKAEKKAARKANWKQGKS